MALDLETCATMLERKGSNVPSIFEFAPLMARQIGPQKLVRCREPDRVTDAASNVIQYDRVMGTKLVLAYAAALETIHRVRPAKVSGDALDLACGPGHFTLCLSRYLSYDKVLGIDLSAPMISTAKKNTVEQSMTQSVSFDTGDATSLNSITNDRFELTTFCDAAHHMPDLDTVAKVLAEMDRVTKPNGLIFLMDLVRLRTESLTESYVNLLGHDYVERGLPDFFEDFRNSMYAAWTDSELAQAIPRQSHRYWVQIVPRGLPSAQIVLGLPVGRKRTFLRSGIPWDRGTSPIPAEMRGEWRLMRTTLKLAARKVIPRADAA